jgi:hypothetical protein
MLSQQLQLAFSVRGLLAAVVSRTPISPLPSGVFFLKLDSRRPVAPRFTAQNRSFRATPSLSKLLFSIRLYFVLKERIGTAQINADKVLIIC